MEGGINRELLKCPCERAIEELKMTIAMLEKEGYKASIQLLLGNFARYLAFILVFLSISEKSSRNT